MRDHKRKRGLGDHRMIMDGSCVMRDYVSKLAREVMQGGLDRVGASCAVAVVVRLSHHLLCATERAIKCRLFIHTEWRGGFYCEPLILVHEQHAPVMLHPEGTRVKHLVFAGAGF